MSTTLLLKDTLVQAAEALDSCDRRSMSLRQSTRTDAAGQYLRKPIVAAEKLRAAAEMLDVREAARERLAEMRREAERRARVAERPLPVSRQQKITRILALQSYLVTTWSICDVVTWCFVHLACPTADAFLKAADVRGVSLLTLMRADQKPQPATALLPMVRERFGCSLAQSYALRNILAHDAGATLELFESVESGNPFVLSGKAVTWLQNDCKSLGVAKEWTARSAPWPDPPDVLHILEEAHVEVDEALGVLATTASASVATLVRFMARPARRILDHTADSQDEGSELD